MAEKIKNIIFITVLFVSASLSFAPFADAACAPGETCGQGVVSGSSGSASGGGSAASKASDPCHPELDNPPGHSLTDAQLASCEACNNKLNANNQVSAADVQKCLKSNPLIDQLDTVVNVLAGLVGVVCVAVIVLGGIQYSMARNNPQEVGAARKRIANAVVAMVAFMLLWGVLQWLVPGGVFNS